jgi:hypothetical protein
MKTRLILTSLSALALFSSAACSRTEPTNSSNSNASQTSRSSVAKSEAPTRSSIEHGHGDELPSARVPAFQTDVASLKNLPPTLSPDLFKGKQKLSYQVVKEIPETIAQLPCYCHCDRGFGHKSLHSCFVDDHAAHCAVCVDEALLAYRLQKEEKLTPEQIRERIVAQYKEQ